jgi:hypothetical protein
MLVRSRFVPLAALLGIIAVTACSSATRAHTAERHSGAEFRAARTIAVLDNTADRALADIQMPGQIFGLAGRLANPDSSIATPVTTDGGAWVGPGRYVLAFECLGTGKIQAATWIGQARTHVTADCRPLPVLTKLYLAAPRAGALFAQFVATQRETVAVVASEGRVR